MPGGHLYGEKVRCSQDFPVHCKKLRPAHARLASLRCRIDMMAAQDVAHRELVDVMSEIRQRALHATVTPGGVLLGHAHDQLLDFLSDTRSAKLLSLRAAVKLLRDQSVVPAQEGLWRHEGRHCFEAFPPKRVGERREAPAFRGRQA